MSELLHFPLAMIVGGYWAVRIWLAEWFAC